MARASDPLSAPSNRAPASRNRAPASLSLASASRARASSGLRLLACCFALTFAAPACGAMVRTFTGRQVTGTCAGACDRYVTCKAGSTEADRTRCLTECPEVFSDSESIGAFESLDCPDLVTYVDGNADTRAELTK